MVRVLRVPVFLIQEHLAAALSIMVGLATAVALFLMLSLATRRRRQRRTAKMAAEVGGAEYRKLTTALVANLSHELFTPLTPVKGYASMLRRHDLPPDRVHQVADEMSHASARLQRVIGTLVTFAEVQSGGVDVRSDVVDVGALVRDATVHTEPDETHSISVRIDPDVPRIQGNEHLLAAAIDALIDNAVKFAPDGGSVLIDVRAASGEAGRELEIRVSDQGVGMTRAELQVASVAFRQVDGSNTRRFGGLGIGVALADRVARAHGGRLQASSRPGKGSTFVLRMPLIPVEHPLPVPARVEALV